MYAQLVNVLTTPIKHININIVNVSLIYRSCSVFGHSQIEISNGLCEELNKTFEELITQGCNTFFFGGFGMFDGLCWEIVTSLKKKYPNLHRIFCLSDPRHLRLSKRPKWLKDEDYEEIVYFDLEFDWWYRRIYFRNCKIIDKSDVVLFYVKNSNNSGAYKAMQYAKRKKKYVINFAK